MTKEQSAMFYGTTYSHIYCFSRSYRTVITAQHAYSPTVHVNANPKRVASSYYDQSYDNEPQHTYNP